MTKIAVVKNDVIGVTHVKRGGILVAAGSLLGGHIIETGGKAVVSGQVYRNVLNDGILVLKGRVAGKILGKGPVVMDASASVSNIDLPVQPASAEFAA